MLKVLREGKIVSFLYVFICKVTKCLPTCSFFYICRMNKWVFFGFISLLLSACVLENQDAVDDAKPQDRMRLNFDEANRNNFV